MADFPTFEFATRQESDIVKKQRVHPRNPKDRTRNRRHHPHIGGFAAGAEPVVRKGGLTPSGRAALKLKAKRPNFSNQLHHSERVLSYRNM